MRTAVQFDKPVALLWGVGAAMQRRLAVDGIALIGQLAEVGERELAARYGRAGARMVRLARGEDGRAVDSHAPTHSISAESTLARDEPMRRRWRTLSGRSANGFRPG